MGSFRGVFFLAIISNFLFSSEAMGVNDRDYMKDDGGSGVLNVNTLVKRLIKTGVFLVVLLLCLRIPVLWIKIPLSCAALFFGIRWILKPEVKRVRKVPRTSKKMPASPKQGALSDHSDKSVVEKLISLDAAGEFGQAKSLIQQLDGQEFSKSEGEELAVIAGNYFPVQLEPSAAGVRFMLV